MASRSASPYNENVHKLISNCDINHYKSRIFKKSITVIKFLALISNETHMLFFTVVLYLLHLGDNDEKNKKGTKRKKPPPSTIENDFLPKRRSARVNTSLNKKIQNNERNIVYLVYQLIPLFALKSP